MTILWGTTFQADYPDALDDATAQEICEILDEAADAAFIAFTNLVNERLERDGLGSFTASLNISNAD